jgi:hypothetical protein
MRNVFFVCLSHTLTADQIKSLNTTFGEGDVVLVSSELKSKTSQIPANATLQEIQALAAEVVAEAALKGATHFICQGEPTFAMWANLIANRFMSKLQAEVTGSDVMPWMHCITSTTERVSVDTMQADGSITKTSVFKHVQWRNLF